ncbi:MAG: ZIP family metal transporter [Candidatus Hydrothermarchaeota archaeon]|nr:ZIP family metal transporter [Candidatus Hydrothermarchaeota archaeon]
MHILIAILASVFIVSIISLIGIFSLMLREGLLKRILFILIAFAAGALLGAAFLDLIPEAMEESQGANVFGYVLFGILSFFVLERFIFWRHCHDGKCDVQTFSYLNLVGDGVHNFIDGMVIAAAFLTNVPLGVVTTIAIIFHEIPQEIGDFGILVYGGFSRFRALFYNFLSSLTAFIGAISTYFFSSYIESSLTFLIALAAGGFIYIATADLMPELQKEVDFEKSVVQLFSLIAGILLLWALILFFE